MQKPNIFNISHAYSNAAKNEIEVEIILSLFQSFKDHLQCSGTFAHPYKNLSGSVGKEFQNI